MKHIKYFLFFLLMALPAVHCPALPSNEEQTLNKAKAMIDSNPDEAIVLLKQLYEKGIKDNNAELCAEALNQYAWCMYQKGDNELSMSLYYNALNYCPPNKPMLLAEIKTGLGVICGYFGKTADGDRYLLQALEIAKKHTAARMITRIYIDLGSLHVNNNNKIKGKHYYKLALIYAQKLKDKRFESRILGNIGTLEKDLNVQLGYFNQSLALSQSINDLYNVCANYCNIAECYYNMQRFTEALQILEKSDEQANSIDAKDISLYNLGLRAKIYAAQKEYELAFACINQKDALRDKINSAKRLQELDHKITSRQLLKLREQNELQKKETEIYQSRIYILLAGIAAIIISLFVLSRFLIYRKQKKNEFMQQQYELEKAQNKVMELEMEKKEQQLSQVSNELQNTKERLDYMQLFFESRNELLEKIRQKIRENYKLDGNEHVTHLKNVNSFIAQFQIKRDAKTPNKQEQQKQAFINRLKEKFPSITEGECTLAVYIRAGLSSKEISLLTGTQTTSVETSRHRLRKALELATENNMTEFLQQI